MSGAGVTRRTRCTGSGCMSIQKMPAIQLGGMTWKKYQKRPAITYRQAKEFQEELTSTHLKPYSQSYFLLL